MKKMPIAETIRLKKIALKDGRSHSSNIGYTFHFTAAKINTLKIVKMTLSDFGLGVDVSKKKVDKLFYVRVQLYKNGGPTYLSRMEEFWINLCRAFKDLKYYGATPIIQTPPKAM